jgi:hypothetical protein
MSVCALLLGGYSSDSYAGAVMLNTSPLSWEQPVLDPPWIALAAFPIGATTGFV